MKVSFYYLFSKNYSIGSKIISWGTSHLSERSDIPSHAALLIEDRWVIESTFNQGVRIIPYKKWLRINKLVEKIPSNTGKIEFKVIKDIFKDIKGKKYDWEGVCYFAVHVAGNKFFNTNIPQINKWQSSDKYFCCEAVAVLLKLGNFSMKSPVQILDEIKYIQQNSVL